MGRGVDVSLRRLRRRPLTAPSRHVKSRPAKGAVTPVGRRSRRVEVYPRAGNDLGHLAQSATEERGSSEVTKMVPGGGDERSSPRLGSDPWSVTMGRREGHEQKELRPDAGGSGRPTRGTSGGQHRRCAVTTQEEPAGGARGARSDPPRPAGRPAVGSRNENPRGPPTRHHTAAAPAVPASRAARETTSWAASCFTAQDVTVLQVCWRREALFHRHAHETDGDCVGTQAAVRVVGLQLREETRGGGVVGGGES